MHEVGLVLYRPLSRLQIRLLLQQNLRNKKPLSAYEKTEVYLLLLRTTSYGTVLGSWLLTLRRSQSGRRMPIHRQYSTIPLTVLLSTGVFVVIVAGYDNRSYRTKACTLISRATPKANLIFEWKCG